MRLLALACSALIASCGGGGDDEAAPPLLTDIAPGVYGAFDEATGDSFELFAGSDGNIVFADNRRVAGLGSTSPGIGSVGVSAAYLTRKTDDLGNGAPGAQPPARQVEFQLREHPTGYAGDGLRLSRSTDSAPDIASLPRNWQFHNLYRFDSDFIDYTASIDVDSAGVMSGFDTNGCQFRGQISRASATLYSMEMVVHNCGATLRFIPNGDYRGYGYVITVGGSTSIRLVGADRGLRQVLALTLFAR